MKIIMKRNLEKLMEASGDNAYTLAEKSGVPQPTIQRFLAGKHGEPRSSTVQKWASVYGVTESQLRGDTSIVLKGVDTSNVIAILKIVRKLNKNDIESVLQLCKRLEDHSDHTIIQISGRKRNSL
jgi:transcriptional regulator with XRE-family HTH domain